MSIFNHAVSNSVLHAALSKRKKEDRCEAVKKLHNESFNQDMLKEIRNIVLHHEDSRLKREFVSLIGRKKDIKHVDMLLDFTFMNDPGVVLQAVRGLLHFKEEERVYRRLMVLQNHDNVTICDFARKAYVRKKTQKKNNHTSFPTFLDNCFVLGDATEVLSYVPDDSFHLTFTSPPYYNARDYSVYKSYKSYLSFLGNIFALLYHKTKEGRFFILNTSPVITPRVSRQYASQRHPIPFDLHTLIIDAGWEFIDDIIWVKPDASVKNRVGGFMQHRKPLGYKPNSLTEYLFVYRKKSDKLIDWVMKQYDKDIVERSKVLCDFERTNVWNIDPVFNKLHPAVFPEKLCEKVIRYYSFIGDLVFDPFGGSGTVGRTANKMNRSFFSTENNEIYFNQIKRDSRSIDAFHKLITCLSKQEFVSVSRKYGGR